MVGLFFHSTIIRRVIKSSMIFGSFPSSVRAPARSSSLDLAGALTLDDLSAKLKGGRNVRFYRMSQKSISLTSTDRKSVV